SVYDGSGREVARRRLGRLQRSESVAVDLKFYDSAEYYDNLHRARNEAGHRPVAMLETLGALLQNAITLVSMVVVVSRFGFWISGALLLSTVPALYVYLTYAMKQHLWRVRSTSEERRAWYYDWLLTSGDSAAEIRLFRLGPLFESCYARIRGRLRRQHFDLAKQQVAGEAATGAGALVLTGGVVVWTVWRAARGSGTLGDAAMLYQAFQQGLRLMRSVLENVRELYANTLFLSHLFDFLGLSTELKVPAIPAAVPEALRNGIRFRDVSFRYPGAERDVLDRLNLDLPAGRITAVLGRNGAGKSTLVKLLCRYYDPTGGRIEFDGVDFQSMAPDELRQRMAVLFQLPMHYYDTAHENIRYGNLKADQSAVRRAGGAAGANEIIEALPAGYETVLGRWFDSGLELSVGEWQRVALARSFLRDAPVILLDEPTSAMDPWTETEWLARFRSQARDKTALIITHRLSTAMAADLIHVMDHGRVVESGTHEELASRAGLYAQCLQARAQDPSVPI
ncbi:MAG: ABC transporter ATP-binding protein/permease, partial [Acidobacteriia bacterium]|nr:ABC transporter ATP-binding protein/permease [Terriglobia bacterium]